jgi:hypothetical protein
MSHTDFGVKQFLHQAFELLWVEALLYLGNDCTLATMRHAGTRRNLTRACDGRTGFWGFILKLQTIRKAWKLGVSGVTITRIRTGVEVGELGLDSHQRKTFYSSVQRPDLEPIPVQRCKANHSPPSSDETKNVWSCTSTSPYFMASFCTGTTLALTAWCKHGNIELVSINFGFRGAVLKLCLLCVRNVLGSVRGQLYWLRNWVCCFVQ